MTGRLLIILLICPASLLSAQSRDVVSVHVDESVLHEGKNSTVFIRVEVKEGYHIQANRIEDESLIPTTVEMNSNEKITVAGIKFPRPKKFKLEGTDMFLSVYDGQFLIKLSLRPSANASAGKHIVRAKLQYQACDSARCLFPRAIDFLIPLEVKLKSS